MKALVTGATGFIGRHLLSRLKQPIALSRHGSKSRHVLDRFDLTTYDWDPVAGPPSAQAFDDVDVVFHLAGESIASSRWTEAKKKRIYASRISGTRHLVSTIATLAHPPRVLISASAVGYYGSRGDELLLETAAPGSDFLAELCVEWEAAAAEARNVGTRVVLPRIGLVLGPDGGALATMLKPFQLGMGGRLGSGRQWMPWIYIDDIVRLLLFLASHETLQGPVNATSPEPCTNAQFTAALGKAINRPVLLPVPKLALRMALGQFADVLLASQRVVPAIAQQAGFTYKVPQLDQALAKSIKDLP